MADDCSDPRWKWFKDCLGALDGTFINVRVPEHEKGRYRTRKGLVVVNVLGVCNPNMQFIFVLSGWEGSAANSRVLGDAIHRTNGLRVPTGTMDTNFISTAHVNTSEDEGSSQQKRHRNNKDRNGSRRTWTMIEEEALINGLRLSSQRGGSVIMGFGMDIWHN
ncbi:UNVERIFIED_CONTAM: hypothetical protein Sradi_7131800 [Sesamum radiatum]|uniref:DDE Tnp4 domain-containing protein n=1 Tax=Sesamum radiatum TaxID=300843 RepID=A0AAW2IXH0_SESRA